jgi:hypothetical protein
MAIRVYVAQKRAPEDVPPEEMIPAEIDGHPTDVIQRTFERIAKDTGRYDPVLGGISIGPDRENSAGTLGTVVKDRSTGALMLLSNFHVLCGDDGHHTKGDEIVQPGRLDGGASPGDTVGTLERFQLTGTVDAAICRLSGRGNSFAVQDLGITFGKRVLDHFDVINSTPVWKRGRTTRITFGTIDSIDLTVGPSDYGSFGMRTFQNQIVVKVDPAQSTDMVEKGDSGSVLMTRNNQIVGLLFLAASQGAGGLPIVGAVANQIVDVLDALDIDLCTPDLPQVTNIDPPRGVQTGGTTVTVAGTGLLGTTAVGFGAASSPNFTVVSDTEITAETPAGFGVVDVTVTTPHGGSLDNPLDRFEFTAPLEIQAIIPALGPEAGGTDVGISGTGFTDATGVTFDGVDATFTVVADDQISATTPAGSGDVDVVVTTPSGSSPAATFSFLPVPEVTSISPSSAPSNVFTQVVITGSGFTAVQAVSFDGTAASVFTVDSDTQITVTVPPGSPSTVDITVTTPGGTSATSADDEYTYDTPMPEVKSVDPAHGPSGGSTGVTIKGLGFTNASDVSFGQGNSVPFVFVDDATITTSSPGGNPGDTVDVLVTTPVGTSDPTLLDEFVYDP